ncbi:MAG: maleate cis-trans isomerase [Alphaproteobacteria bacterium]|nr:maleate cis-trans isomerase [Alphaproteobacteria bacterium]
MATPGLIKHRVGLLIPSSNTNIEPEYYSVMPASVSTHFARIAMTAVNDEGLSGQDQDVARQSELLAAAQVDVILFCLTAASFVLGLDYDTGLKQRIESASGKPALTAAQTIVDALNTIGVRRIAMATPFVPEVNEVSRAFMAANGFDVVSIEGLGLVDNFSIALTDYETVRALVWQADHSDAEAIVIPGGNMPCLEIAPELEQELKKPVVTTNQAGIWALLRHLGGFHRLDGRGLLLNKYLST